MRINFGNGERENEKDEKALKDLFIYLTRFEWAGNHRLTEINAM